MGLVDWKTILIGLDGVRGVKEIPGNTLEALRYAAKFGQGALLKVHHDETAPFELVFANGISSLSVMSWCIVRDNAAFLYVDEEYPIENQKECCRVITSIAQVFDLKIVIMSPVIDLLETAVANHGDRVCFLAGDLLSRGIDPLEEAKKVEGLGGVALYGGEFDHDRTKKLQDAGYCVIYNIRNSADKELICRIAATGAWIVCNDPQKTAQIIRGMP